MASLKSLMKARKASSRLEHPHARYSPAGQLSCALCHIPLKADSLWGSHLVSKQHRVNVQQWEAQQAAQAATTTTGKRKRDDSDSAPDDDDAAKRPRDDQDAHDARGLPADFFADPSQAPPPRAAASPEPTGEQPGAPGQTDDDPDWAEFEAYLASAPAPSLPSSSVPGAPPSRSTATATISAAPVAYEFGAPKVAQAGEEGDGEGEEEEEQGETEEERIEREMREEREEMMARLEEEEREQKEADEKVTVLKRRLEAIRAARKKKAPA
ncbi:hypothetical protein JCM1840_005042 [Sporobolomyces johnsonii]